MTKKFVLILAVALVALIGISVGVYNHFKLWYFKGLWGEYVKNYFENPKCDFNPLVNPNGGGQNVDSAFHFIAHAGGGIVANESSGEIFAYTNSLEALIQSIDEGFKLIELDLALDKDGDIFAAHDYKHFYKITNAPNYADYLDYNAFAPPSKDYIKGAKIYGRFTPLDKDAINAIFSANPSVYLVTDKLNDFSAIENQLNFGKDRIIIEIFALRDYFRARKMGFKYAMFSTSDIAFAVRHKIPFIAIHTSAIQSESGAKLAREYIANGGGIFAYSSNESAFINAHKGKSVSAFYVDYYDINADKCKLSDKSKCETY